MFGHTSHEDGHAGRPLRILQVLEPSGGGSGRHFVDLCGALAGRGHEVTAIYSPLRAEPRFVEELKALPLKAIHAVPMKRLPHPSDALALWKIRQIAWKEGPFDIIHGHSSKAGYLIRLRLPGVPHTPTVYTPHAFRTMDPTLGDKGRFLFGEVESLLGRYFTDKLICVSQDEYEHAISLGIPEDCLATVVNGVKKPETANRNAIRESLGFEPSNFVFGFVGRLAAQKAPERLVEAFARVVPAFPDARLVMVGFGELENDIRARISRLGITDRTIVTNELAGPEAMQAFDALVMPSRYEAMSYAMLEAAAAGKPLILSNIGGASTVLEDGVNGRMVSNSDNPRELAEAMLEFSQADRAMAYALAAYAREDRYQLDTMVDQTIAVYEELAGRRHATHSGNTTGSEMTDLQNGKQKAVPIRKLG